MPDAENGFIKERTKSGQFATTITVGMRQNIDVVLGIPYQWYSIRQDNERIGRADGISDISLDLKWRVIEQDGWSFALKPGITLLTGDDERDFGNGRPTYKMYFIATKEIAPWAFHANLGYVRNKNSFGDRKDLWHASAAAEFEFIKNVKRDMPICRLACPFMLCKAVFARAADYQRSSFATTALSLV